MFDYFIGAIKSKNPASAVLEVNGIAFRFMIPVTTYEKLPASGEAKIFADLAVQGGMQSPEIKLYGFATAEERQMFQLLLSVNRVGPSMALRIISGGSPQQISQAILSDNIRFLSKIKGVGEKTAQRIIMELKETISVRFPMTQTALMQAPDQTAVTDAILALVALGYQRTVAEKSVKEVLISLSPRSSTEDIVRKALTRI